MKLSKLIPYMLKVSGSDTLTVIAADNKKAYLVASDGITEAIAIIDRASMPMEECWPVGASVSVPKTQIERAYRDDATWGMKNGVLKLFNGRWQVDLPADTVKDADLPTPPELDSAKGVLPPALHNVNTTDAFGSDVWVTFSRGKKDADGKRTSLVGITSVYTGVVLHGLEVSSSGSFPAKILPAVKPLRDVSVFVESSAVIASGKYPLAANVSADLIVTSAIPSHSTAPPLSEVTSMIASIPMDSPASVNAITLREVVKAVTALLPDEAKNLRLKCATGKQGGHISISLSADTAKYSETIDANIAKSAEFLLPTGMFKLCLAGIEMNKDTLAVIKHSDNAVRIDIVQPGTKKRSELTLVASMLLAVADDQEA